MCLYKPIKNKSQNTILSISQKKLKTYQQNKIENATLNQLYYGNNISEFKNLLYHVGMDLNDKRKIIITYSEKFYDSKNKKSYKKVEWKHSSYLEKQELNNLIIKHMGENSFYLADENQIGFGMHKNSTAEIIDIDNKRNEECHALLTENETERMKIVDKENQEIIKDIVFFLQDPTFLEHADNKFSKGYHLYYIPKDYIPKNIIENLKHFIFKKYGRNIEVYNRFSKNSIRILFNKDYRKNIGIYDPNSPTLIKNLPLTEIMKLANPYCSPRRVWKTKATFELSDFYNNDSLISQNINKKPKKSEKINGISTSDYRIEKYKFGNGNRNYKCTQLAGCCYFLEEYKELALLCHDGTSKDIRKNGLSWFLNIELPKIWKNIESKRKYSKKENYEKKSNTLQLNIFSDIKKIILNINFQF